MARTAIAINSLKGASGDGQLSPTVTAGDSANGHSWAFQEGDILVVENLHASTTSGTITVKGGADAQGRTCADSVKTTIAALAPPCIWGPLAQAAGWVQSDGTVQVDLGSSAGTLKLYVLRR